MKTFRISLLTVLFAFFLSPNLHSQSLQARWAGVSGSDTLANYNFTAGFSDGSACQLGYFKGTYFSVGDSSFTRQGYIDGYVAIYSPDGVFAWACHIIPEGNNEISLLNYSVDANDILNLAISTNASKVTIGDSTVNIPMKMAGSQVLLRLDKDGHILTFTTILPSDNTAEIFISAVSWDRQGRMAMAGSYQYGSIHSGTMTLPDPGEFPATFVYTFDENLVTLWGAKSDYAKKSDEGFLMDISPEDLLLSDNDQSVTIRGVYETDSVAPVFGTDTLPLSTAIDEFSYIPTTFLVRYDASGNYLWSLHGSNNVKPDPPGFLRIKELSTGAILVTGHYNEDKFTLGSVTLNFLKHNPEGFLIEISPDGDTEWGFIIPGSKNTKNTMNISTYYSDVLGEIQVDSRDNIYLSGRFTENMLVFPNEGDTLYLSPGHSQDEYLAQYRPDGSFGWSQLITSYSFTAPYSVINKKDQIFLTSMTEDSLIFEKDTLPVDHPYEEWVTYLVGFDTSGNVISKNTIENASLNVSFYPRDITVNNRGDLFLLGWTKGGHTADGISFEADYNLNIDLIRYAPAAGSVIQGYVFDPDGNPLYPGELTLFHLNNDAAATPVATLVPQDDGSYVFYDIPPGNYLLYLVSDYYNNTIGTYYTDAVFWNEADTLSLDGDTLSNINLTLLEFIAQLDGQDTLMGNVSYGIIDGGKSITSVTGEPVKKVKVILIKKDKSTDNIVAWVYTDDEGNFVFENVPDGTYTIVVDIAGLPMGSTYTVTVTGNNITGLDFIVTGKEILIATPVGIFPTAAPVEKIKIWPVPATGTVSLQTGKMTGGTLTLLNLQGEILMTHTIDQPLMTLDLSDLPDGLYYLRAVKDNHTGLAKIIIRH